MLRKCSRAFPRESMTQPQLQIMRTLPAPTCHTFQDRFSDHMETHVFLHHGGELSGCLLYTLIFKS